MIRLSRREALMAGASLAVATAAPARAAAAELESYDMLGLAELIRKRDISATELLEDTIKRADIAQGRYNYMARPLYERAKKSIAAGLPEGPFTGVPFMLKDLNMRLAGERLGQGSNLYSDYRATETSELTRRYEKAGLVICAYTNTPEFGLTGTTESAATGATLNPWNPRHSSGGSSGGAAVAVAAGVVPGAHASDGGGSIRIPASACGLFGLKPSRGRVPMGPPRTEGWGGLSTHHAITRSVRDCAALLDISHGIEPGSRYGAPSPERPYLEEVGRAPGKLRVAYAPVAVGGTKTDPEVAAATAEAARLMEALGHEVEEVTLPGNAAELAAANFALIGPAVAADCDARAAALGQELQGLVEPMTYAMIQAGRYFKGTDVARANATLQEHAVTIGQFMQNYDVILQPTMAILPVEIGVASLSSKESMEVWGARVAPLGVYAGMWNATGQPSMSVPFAQSKSGLPIGVMFTGRYGDEALLFRLAGQLEQARPWATAAQ